MKKILIILFCVCFSLPVVSQDFTGVREKITRLEEEIIELRRRYKTKQLRNAYFNLGELYYEDHLFNEAVEAWDEAFSLRPGKKILKILHLYLGRSFEQLKKYDKAISHYKQACALMPKNPECYTDLGRTYLLVELMEQSLEQYQKALELDAENAQAYRGIASIYQKQGLFSRAIDHYERSLTVEPGNDTVYLNLSLIYQRLNQLDLAVDMQLSAIKVLPSTERYIRLGFLHTLMKEYDEAMKYFAHARELDPYHEDIYLHIGVTAYQIGSFEEAREALDEVLTINADHALGYFYRSLVNYRSNKIDLALADAEQAYTHAKSKILSKYSLQLMDMLKSLSTR